MSEKTKRQEDLKKCISFHGHLCPGLIYGYRVAKEAASLLNVGKSADEEVVAVCENDSCAIDAFQIILGTTAGKGNLIINNYGKNVYTVYSRNSRKAIRFSRIFSYNYSGNDKEEFEKLEAALQNKTASNKEIKRQKYLKAVDLAEKPFNEVFSSEAIPFDPPPYAPLAPSEPCIKCGELTMKTKMIKNPAGNLLCQPCSGLDKPESGE